VSYPTDLTDAERQTAQTRLLNLAEQFTTEGILRTPVWREVFQRTWRHPYVPSYYPERDAPCLLCIDPQRRGEWLDAVYSNTTLITKVVQVPLSRELRPGTGVMYTSSSTLPSLILRMLEALDVTDGCRVLEIGTGSGYNAALLCERLGSAYVTSIDIDPELIDLARERLAANGYTPTLAAINGIDGYPPGVPYDRIIATCAVASIPTAWLTQAAPGAVILTDVHGQLGGTLARLTVDDHGTAMGRFLPHWAGFMAMRHTVDVPTTTQRPWLDGEPTHSMTDLDPTLLQTHGLFGFVAQWHVPDTTLGSMTDDNGDPAVYLSGADGSQAVITTTQNNGSRNVTQSGPRRLWDRVEQAHQFWIGAGQPNYDRFGITATTEGQHIWYDHPDSPHRWPLPTTIAE
jgi:methyltransferase of ATP-grasp peptide maturase system